MGTEESTVGAALFGATRQALLRLLFGHTGERFYQRQIIRMIGLGSGAVQRDLGRLAGAGILARSVEGRQTYYQANVRCAVFEELRGLVRKTFGIAEVLRKGLRPLAGKVELAFIYGSMAAGRETAASDIDVMVVGRTVSLDDVVAAFADAQGLLGREVNPSVYRSGEFYRRIAEGQHFVSSVAAGPKIFLIGDENEFARLPEVRMAQRPPDKPGGDRRPLRAGRSRSGGVPDAGTDS